MPTGHHKGPRGVPPIADMNGEVADAIRVNMTMTRSHRDALDALASALGLGNRSEVVRKLIEDAHREHINNEG